MTFKQLRERANLSTEQASKLLEKKVNTIRVYECSVRLPSTEVLIQMKREYRASEKEIMRAYEYHKRIYEGRTRVSEGQA